jgi:hypothetical protein
MLILQLVMLQLDGGRRVRDPISDTTSYEQNRDCLGHYLFRESHSSGMADSFQLSLCDFARC